MKEKLTTKFKNYLYKTRHRIHERHIRSTTIALILTIPYFISEWSARAFNLYVSFPQIDNFVHASFGVAFAALAYILYHKSPKLIITWSFIVSILWEILEIIGDHLPYTSVIQDPFFWDGIKDISVAFFAAVITVYILKRVTKRQYFRIVVD